MKENAVELAEAMASEDGVEGAVRAFFKHLPRRDPDPKPSSPPSDFFKPCFGSIGRCFGCS